jgi:hypothetical protein
MRMIELKIVQHFHAVSVLLFLIGRVNDADMENIITLNIAADVIAPAMPEEHCPGAIFFTAVQAPDPDTEDLETVRHIKMITAMHESICRLNKGQVADYLYCGILNTSFPHR